MAQPAPNPGPEDDRRLHLRMHLSLLIGIAICGLGLLAATVAGGRLVAAQERRAEILVSLERVRAEAELLGHAAFRAREAETPARRLISRARLETGIHRFAESAAAARAALGAEAGELTVRLAEIAEADRAVAAAPQGPDAARAAGRLRHLAGPGLRRDIALRIDAAEAAAQGLADRLRLAWLGAGAVAVALLLAVLRWAVRPLADAADWRRRALAAAKAEVARTLLFDGLTSLPNRRNLQQTLARLDPTDPLAVLHIDLPGFHAINTTLGWETGDQLLRYAGETLGEVALAADIVARVDTDEFVLATPRRTDPEQLQELAVEIIEKLGTPIEIDGHSVALEAVIGIAARTLPGEAADKLLANADIARARAREEGGSVYFSHGMRERLAARRQTAQDLLQALVRDELEPYFQPQIDAATGRVTGFEVLLRWRHPDRGVLNPHFFLDIAAQAHLGRRIAGIMLKKSVAALADWRARGHAVPRIALNFSLTDLRDPDLPDQIAFDLDRAGLGPQDLAVEVLESALIESADDPILANIAALRRAGHHIDLDDFGTGHAAISHLQHLRVDRLKIDRSFVRDIHLRPELRKMTQAMIQLAKTLDIQALAEGIETRNEWRLLLEMGCDDLQGFAIGTPMPAEEVPAWLAEHDRRRSAGRLIAAA